VCASLVEREEKGFEVALKRWKRDYCLLRWAGSEFQFEGLVYANERPPYEASFTRGKSRWPWSADRRWRWPEMPETGWQYASITIDLDYCSLHYLHIIKQWRHSSTMLRPLFSACSELSCCRACLFLKWPNCQLSDRVTNLSYFRNIRLSIRLFDIFTWFIWQLDY